MLWNTRYMDVVLDQLRAGGNVLRDEDIERLSPLVHEHINLHGRYYFGVTEAVQRGDTGRGQAMIFSATMP